MSNNKHKRDQIIQNTRKETATVIPEVSYKHKVKQQTFFDKYRTKLLTAAAVLTFATPAAITAVQDGNFNPLAAIQAESGDDISKEITGLEMKLVNSDGSDINDSKVNPYRQYNLYLKTQSNITIGSGRIEVGDFFYINVPEELDYTAVQQMVADTNDFKYSIKVVEKDGQKQLRVEINDIMNLPINAFETEMTLPVKFADTINQEVTLTASTQGATSNEQTVIIQSREKSDISNQTDVALKVVEMTDEDAENFSEITSAVDPATVLGLQLSFTFNTDDLMPGDTFTVELPKELEYVDGAAVNIARPEMQVAGKINGNDKTATFTVIRVPKGTGQAEAMKTTVAAPFDLLEIPINGGEVTLTATTAKNSASQKITISQASVSRDVTASVKNLTFDLTDEDGETVAQNAEVNPYKVYGMNINVDMGENAGVQQLKAGDYVDIELPDMMDIDINEIKKMINNTPNFESVGRIFNDDNGHKVLRTIITKVPRSISNTVTFGYKLFVPFNIEKILQIQDYNNTRYFSLTMKTTAQDNKKSIVLPLCVVNLGNPEVPAGDLYSPPSEFLFNNAGRTNEANILKPQYQISQFVSKPRKADGSLSGKFYDYSIYTLVKIEKGHGRLGLQSRWTPKWDKVASNVDPTKKHWSASQGYPSEPDDSSVPNAGPENYINAYCIEGIKYRWVGDGLKPKVTANNGDYRYMQEDFETFFYKEVYNHISQNEKPEMAKKIKNIMAHSYPFVSEEAMRNYYGFEDDIKLSDIIAATQQYIWDLLYINNSEYAIPYSGAKIGRWDYYRPENMTVQFKNNQYTLDINSDQRVRSAWEKIGLKVNQGYTEKNIEKVKINKISLDDKKENVTIELSKKIDPSETGKLIITTPNGTKEIQLGYKPGYESGKIITTAVSGFDESKEHNFVDVRLELTDNDYLVKFYALHSIGGATQDVITTKIFPRTYTDQSSIKVNCFKGKFEFVKYQAGTQSIIVGAEFELTNQSTGEKFAAVADLEGVVSFDKLPSGTYTLKETKAPAGYILIEKEYTVVVGEDGNATLDGQNISEGIWNNKYEISNPEVKIELIKEDADKTHADNTNRLNGAVFRIDKENGSKEGYPTQYTTQGTGVNAGEIHITGLTDGTYTITEIKAPVGYQLSDEVITFTVNNGVVTRNNGDILNGKDAQKPKLENQPIFVKNEKDAPKYGKIEITKVDFDSPEKALRGATFILKNSATQKSYTQESDDTGKVVFENLPQGDYVLEESKAPEGYDSTDEKWYITITKDGEAKYSKKEKSVKSLKTKGSMIEDSRIDSSNFKVIYPKTDNTYTLVTDTGSDVVSSLDGAFDRNAKTAAIFSPKKRFLGVGDYIGADLGKTQNVRRIHIKQAPAPHENDWYTQYKVQYFDLNQWFDVNNIVYETNEIDIEVNLNTSKIRLLNQKYKENAWMGLETFEVFGKNNSKPDNGGEVIEPDFITEPIQIKNKKAVKAKIKITKIDAKTDNPIGFGDFDSARFAITTKPNPVSTNNGQNSDDIYNGQVANLIGNKGSSFTFENSDKQGFEPGQYYLWEMRAPKGYAKLLDVIPFYIEEDGSIIIPSKEIKQGDMVVGHEVDTEHFAYDMITQPTKVDDTPIFEIKVKNRKVEYPKTGSIGSMIFYMIGLTGVIGSAWMLTKKQ